MMVFPKGQKMSTQYLDMVVIIYYLAFNIHKRSDLATAKTIPSANRVVDFLRVG